ncbi:unnamed protein product, partial [Brassica oleracea]
MKRKRKDHTEINLSEFSPLGRNVRKTSCKPVTVHPLVPVTAVYKRLYDGVCKDASKSYIGSSVQETSYTPISTENRRKCSLGLDLMSNVLFNSPEPRSCLTALSSILEEIDDELDLYCSSQDTTDSENEQIDFDMSVESETAPTNGKEYKRKAGGEKHSGCRTKS